MLKCIECPSPAYSCIPPLRECGAILDLRMNPTPYSTRRTFRFWIRQKRVKTPRASRSPAYSHKFRHWRNVEQFWILDRTQHLESTTRTFCVWINQKHVKMPRASFPRFQLYSAILNLGTNPTPWPAYTDLSRLNTPKMCHLYWNGPSVLRPAHGRKFRHWRNV